MQRAVIFTAIALATAACGVHASLESSPESTGNVSQASTTFSGSAYGMKCNGASDDTAALQAVLNAAALHTDGIPTDTVVTLPTGVCMINSSSTAIQLPDAIWLVGAVQGQPTKTTLRRIAGGSSTTDMLDLAGTNGNVLISDFTLDGNNATKTTAHERYGVGRTVSKSVNGLSVQRMIFVNHEVAAVTLFYGWTPNLYTINANVLDSTFQSNGNSTSQGQDQIGLVGDVILNTPQACSSCSVQVLGNIFSNTQGNAVVFGASASASPGGVQVENNTFTNVLGFAVALGGGGSPVGATISSNTVQYTGSAYSRENVFDIALWSNVVVDSNTINDVVPAGACNPFCGVIGDAPPANNVTVTNNHITGNGTSVAAGIGLGGSNLNITGNTITGVATAIDIENGGWAETNVSIINNDVTSSTGGVGIYLDPASGSTPAATLDGITIAGNTISATSYGVNTHTNPDGGAPTTVAVYSNNFTGTTNPILASDVPSGRIFNNEGVSNGLLLLGGGYSQSGLGGAAFVQTVYVAARGVGTNAVFLNQRTATGNFATSWTEVTGQTTPSTPAVVVDGEGYVRIYVQGMDDQIWRYTVNLQTWTVVPGEGSTGAAPAAITVGGRVYLFVKGVTGDGHMYVKEDMAPWDPQHTTDAYWQYITSATPGLTAAAPAVATNGTSVYIAVLDDSGNGNIDWAKTSNVTFPFQFGAWQATGGTSNFNPTVTMINRVPYIYATGKDSRIYKTVLDGSNDPSYFEIMPGSGWAQSGGSPLALWGAETGSDLVFPDLQTDVLYQSGI
jgi:hypothetical protein